MWKRTKEAVTNCLIFFARCGRPTSSSVNGDFAELLINLNDDMDQPTGSLIIDCAYSEQSTADERNSSTRGPLPRRPDAPFHWRRSTPEIVKKVRLALREMCGADDDFELLIGDDDGNEEQEPQHDRCRERSSIAPLAVATSRSFDSIAEQWYDAA
uniref:Uncharacterized protein n=1 Tax=Trichogramma kaykai TaxID=54128 RepID=A0ABD2X4H8_9HYME